MDIDAELRQTLEQFLERCREFGIRPRLIGGLAVRGFARRKRFTHDIDLAISRHDKPNLIALLKQMGFDYQDLTTGHFYGMTICDLPGCGRNATGSGASSLSR